MPPLRIEAQVYTSNSLEGVGVFGGILRTPKCWKKKVHKVITSVQVDEAGEMVDVGFTGGWAEGVMTWQADVKPRKRVGVSRDLANLRTQRYWRVEEILRLSKCLIWTWRSAFRHWCKFAQPLRTLFPISFRGRCYWSMEGRL